MFLAHRDAFHQEFTVFVPTTVQLLDAKVNRYYTTFSYMFRPHYLAIIRFVLSLQKTALHNQCLPLDTLVM